MFETILSYGAVPIAGFLFARCVLWHVPKLARMIWRGMGETSWRAMNAACVVCGAGNSTYCDCHVAKLPFVPDYAVVERLEVDLFIKVPTAFWLEPTRWTRPTWPALPLESDLRFDRSRFDLALAHATLPDKLRLKTERAWLGGAISSKRTFDRYQGQPVVIDRCNHNWGYIVHDIGREVECCRCRRKFTFESWIEAREGDPSYGYD